ncbi:hypothetical protein VTL71DRAFT_13381 [Oculimacula yallundae]|uniref:Uncharacterized protein n=1 Tax=Oculimacula yallundae TaxID=86028 RepID=A0ABR4CK74_9HELO
MLVKGEVYACGACMTGDHSTRDCEHVDRPLQHIISTATEHANHCIGRVFTFKWPFPASEVFVTGTFDYWLVSYKLKEDGGVFTADVVLDDHAAENVYYKFVVDGNWTVNANDQYELNDFGDAQNLLTPAQISKLPLQSKFTNKCSLEFGYWQLDGSVVALGDNSSSYMSEEGMDNVKTWTGSAAVNQGELEGRFPNNRDIPSTPMEGQYPPSPTGAVYEEDIYGNHGYLDSELDVPIVPDHAGFEAHVRRLNPDMDERYDWLVSRIAHQQEIRYKNLLKLRVRHARESRDHNCSAGVKCVSPALLREKSIKKEAEGRRSDADPVVLNNGKAKSSENDQPSGLHKESNFSDDDLKPRERAFTEDSFPQGVPMPPVRNLPAEFECQLCFRVKKFGRPSDWTKHVQEDTQPFTCTFDKCQELKSFKSRDDWARHENERHRHLEWWICQIDDCRHASYRKDSFLQHLVREHRVQEPEQKTKAAIKKARLTEPAWIMLEESHHKTENRPQDEPCRFCGKSFRSWGRLTAHLAEHMEHITLPILSLVESVAADTLISPVEQISTQVTPMEPWDEELPVKTWDGFENTTTSISMLSTSSGIYAQFPQTTIDDFYKDPSTPTHRISESNFVDSDPRKYDLDPSDVNQSAAHRAGTRAPRGGVDPNIRRSDSMSDIEGRKPELSKSAPKDSSGAPLSVPMPQVPFHTSPSRSHLDQDPPQPGDEDWEFKSIASLYTFRDSALGSRNLTNMSVSEIETLPRTAQEEILIILNSDAKLRSLFEEAARQMNKTRFVRNIRLLFLQFHNDLQESVVDLREKDATRIIEKHAQWLASRLFDVCDPDNHSNNKVMADHLNQHVDKRPLLENYLAAMTTSRLKLSNVDAPKDVQATLANQTKSKAGHVAKTELEESSSEEGEDDASNNGENQIDYSRFPNLDHIRKFIIGGVAYEKLRKNTSEFVHPVLPKPSKSQAQAQTISHELKSVPEPELENISIGYELGSDSLTRESVSSAGTTDITMPDVESDTDSDDMSELSSDPELYNGALEDRILNPKAYFDKLRTTERAIFETLGISPYWISSGPEDDDFFLQGLKSGSHPSSNSALDALKVLSLIKFTMSDKLLQLLECCNHLVRICTSLTKLREIGYCTSQISLLIKDQDRPQVARLLGLQIRIQSILLIEEQDAQLGVTTLCLQVLTSMGFLPHLLLNDVRHIVWNCTVQSLELAVLSHAGAHIQRFDLELFNEDKEAFELPRRFLYFDLTLQAISSRTSSRSISFRRRKLQCLDKFLGGAQPWVFHQNFSNVGDERLYLSAKIDTLTNIWGPSWKIVRDPEPDCIQQLDIGSGAIVPWSAYDSLGEQDIQLQTSEVYCHWISFKEWNLQDIEANQSSLQRKHFRDADTLLIGATNDFGLVVNSECTASIERLFSTKTKLDQQGALRAPNTYRAQRYVDSHAVQVQGSALGFFTAGDTITYKRRVGQTMKDALLERWRHNLRNPMDLEVFSGVEISLCTRNARRRRLLHLLGSPTMYNYLRGITFVWVSEPCEYAYFKALRSPKLFRKFWKAHPEYQANVGDAISKCLDALEETGIDEDSRELRGLWVESFDTEGDSDGESDDGSDDDQPSDETLPPTTVAKPTPNFFEDWIVTLFRSEHTWTGFLEDSEETLTMAVLGMACLDFDHNGYGRRCTRCQLTTTQMADAKGYPVLQTSLQLNATLLTNSKIKQETVSSGQTTIWNAKEVKQGTSFPLGDHGSLKVLTAATRTCPVIMEWHGVKSEIVKEIKNVTVYEKLLGRNHERHHREYIRGKWEAKPLPVLVLSKSNKILFTKS